MHHDPLLHTTLLLAIGIAGLAALEEGSWIPAIDWSAQGRAVGDTLAKIDTPNSTSGTGYAVMHRGYLFVPYSGGTGGGGRSGGFTFYDLADPTTPELVWTTRGSATYDDETDPANYAGTTREAHGYTFSGDIWCMTTRSNPKRNTAEENGLAFWDLSDPTAPVKLSSISIPGLTGGNYSDTAWWVHWQGRYAYVACTNFGLAIIDAADPANPTMADRGGQANPIPTSETGGFSILAVNAVGNLLVCTPQERSQVSILDISDPVNPVLLDLATDANSGYSSQVNGYKIIGTEDPVAVWDLTDPENLVYEGKGPNSSANGGYGMVQDELFLYGSSDAIVQLHLDGLTVKKKWTPNGGFSDPDWDFATPLGNLVFCGNDHGASALSVSHLAPDTTPPRVTMVHPFDGSTHQATTSRVGLTFSDQIRHHDIDQSTVIVRPLGGSALGGRYTHQHGIVSFSPNQPLAADTTYEVVVPAGGLRDWAGNAITEAFSSRFSTGAGGVTPPPDEPPQLTAGPSIDSDPVTDTSAIATVVATDPDGDDGSLRYTWQTLASPAGAPAPAFSPDDSTAAASTTVTFGQAGAYHLQVTVTDTDGLSTTGSVEVVVAQTLSGVDIVP